MIESKVGSTLTENKKDVHTCSITGRKYEGFGNNAYPFKGRCCDFANSYYVIPARIIGITVKASRSSTTKAITITFGQRSSVHAHSIGSLI